MSSLGTLCFFSPRCFPHSSACFCRGEERNIIMNTFTTNTNEKETQSLLQTEEEGKSKKTFSTTRKNALTLGGLAAVGILGLASTKSSSFGSAAPFHGSRLGQTQSTIRLSVGCSPQDVLSLLPFEPKSWRGTVYSFIIAQSISFSRLYASRDQIFSLGTYD